MEHHLQLELLGSEDINCIIMEKRKAKSEPKNQGEGKYPYRKGYYNAQDFEVERICFLLYCISPDLS